MKTTTLAALVALLALTAWAQDKSSDVKIGQKHSLRSQVLNEERAYWVYLPASYDDKTFAPQRYGVLYLLDGDAHFHSASGVVQFMSAGINGNFQIPELIVVAIPNVSQDGRTRDLTPTASKLGPDGKETSFLANSGGGNNFLKFMREELFPTIESSYRTRPYRIFVGHSLGGLLVLHALLDSPELFQAYIAIDPSLWWDNQVLVRRVESLSKDGPRVRGSVYISLAHHPDLGIFDPTKVDQAARRFAAALNSNFSPAVRSTLQYYKDEDHGSVPLLSLYYGLLHTFEGYKPPEEKVFKDPSYLVTHYKSVSERLGMDLLPPESFVNGLGYWMLEFLKDHEKAIECFKINVTNYPASYNVYDSLADAYRVRGDKALAIENYERSLKLNPANTNATTWLQELRGQNEQK